MSEEIRRRGAAPIHARSNDSPSTRADFPPKIAIASKLERYTVIAAMFINLFIFVKRSDRDSIGETELRIGNIY